MVYAVYSSFRLWCMAMQLALLVQGQGSIRVNGAWYHRGLSRYWVSIKAVEGNCSLYSKKVNPSESYATVSHKDFGG